MTLHFAYGANMDRAGMARRCPGAVALGPASLDGYRFVIMTGGYASLARAPGATVHGVLWRLTPRDLAALNIFENLESGLYRRAAAPVRFRGRRMRALVYLGCRGGEGVPRPGYMEAVIAAAREWELPRAHVDALARLRPGAWQGRHPAETGAI